MKHNLAPQWTGDPSLRLISSLAKLFYHYEKYSFEPGIKVHVYN